MLSDSLRQRLEALNRERLPVAQPAPRVREAPAAAKPQATATGFDYEPRTVETAFGAHWLFEVPLAQLWPKGPELVSGRLSHLATQPLGEEMQQLVAATPHRAALLDLETCGFSGSALFLIGLLRWVDGQPTVELLFARHYGEEPAVLLSLWERLEQVDVLATFNGKSFDWPMVMDRSRRHLLHKRMALREPTQVDVLHHARRKWRGVLPNCKLQTIEAQVCRRARGPDIPGAQIPAAYDAFVRTGDPREMRRVLHHNALDLVTLLDIAMRAAG